MKSFRNSYIFAIVIGLLLYTVPQASYASFDSNKITIFANGSEKEFSTYLGKNFPQYLELKNWSIITKVVTLYNQRPSEIRGLSAAEVQNFNSAVAELKNKLQTVNSEEALKWKGDLEETANVIRFIKDFDLERIAGDTLEVQSVKVPTYFVAL